MILGSMPGRASLEQQQYYAQPQNAFWPIMGELCGAGPDLAYADRLQALEEHRIALWDVLASCHRPGSLDSAIRLRDAVANDFAGFLASHVGIARICFNGAKALELYCRLVLPTLVNPAHDLPRVKLPSTSPAHAGMSRVDKLRAWRQAVRGK